MLSKPSHHGVFEVPVASIHRYPRVIFHAASPPGDEGLKLATPLVNCPEISLEIPKHQVDLMVEQNSRDPTSDLQDSLLLQNAEAVSVECSRTDRRNTGRI